MRRLISSLAVLSPSSVVVPYPSAAALTLHGRWGSNVGGTFYAEGDVLPQMDSPLNNASRGVVIKPQSTLLELWDQAVQSFGTRRFMGTKMWIRGKARVRLGDLREYEP
jgi:hypothetical protein